MVVILMGKKIESCVFQRLLHLNEMCPKTMLFYLFQCTKQQIKIKYNSQETSLSKNFDIFYLREDGVFGG